MARTPKHYGRYVRAVERRADQIRQHMGDHYVVTVTTQGHDYYRHSAQVVVTEDGKDVQMPEDLLGCSQCADSEPTGVIENLYEMYEPYCALCSDSKLSKRGEDSKPGTRGEDTVDNTREHRKGPMTPYIHTARALKQGVRDEDTEGDTHEHRKRPKYAISPSSKSPQAGCAQ